MEHLYESSISAKARSDTLAMVAWGNGVVRENLLAKAAAKFRYCRGSSAPWWRRCSANSSNEKIWYITIPYTNDIPIIPLPDDHDIPWHAMPCYDGMICRPRYGPNEFMTCSMRPNESISSLLCVVYYCLVLLYVCQVDGFWAVHTLLIFPSPLCDAKILGRQSCIWKDEAVNVRWCLLPES